MVTSFASDELINRGYNYCAVQKSFARFVACAVAVVEFFDRVGVVGLEKWKQGNSTSAIVDRKCVKH
jgi:hypothetical protein